MANKLVEKLLSLSPEESLKVQPQMFAMLEAVGEVLALVREDTRVQR